MAKVPFTKLKCKINNSVKSIKFNDEIEIEVKQYLPIQEKLKLIGDIVEQAHSQDYNYSNPVKEDVFTELEIIFNYTNLSFTDKQLEDLPKLYDLLSSSGIIQLIKDNIPEEEKTILYCGIKNTIESFYKYQNSILGLLDTIGTDYSELNLDVEELQRKLKDPESLDLVKNILTKLN